LPREGFPAGSGVSQNQSHDLAVVAKFVMVMVAMLAAMFEAAMLKAAFVTRAAHVVLTVAIVLCNTQRFVLGHRRGRSGGRHRRNRGAKHDGQNRKFQGLFQVQHFNLLWCVLHSSDIGIAMHLSQGRTARGVLSFA
jgi:hypothetical protein